jgi:urease accessory protein
MRRLTCLAAFVLLAVAVPASAHPGHDPASAGVVAGLLNPLLAPDHLLAMLAVGVWAAQRGAGPLARLAGAATAAAGLAFAFS